jgi:NAD(P)-dependent dehydrogenase (short-subunit alcohol dehydrogenase family)
LNKRWGISKFKVHAIRNIWQTGRDVNFNKMAKIFITGSADGLGQLAAKELVKQGHEVVLHARNAGRGEQALKAVPGAKDVLIADLSDMSETKALAEKANALGGFDAVIHNAGVYQTSAWQLLHVNTLAPYLLTGLMHRPKRLIYLSSGMHLSGHPQWAEKPSYADTKLHMLMLAKTLALKWPEVYANAVDPGWVPTKMGGAGAPDDLNKGYQTQVWLAVSDEPRALVSGQYFHHQRQARYNRSADDTRLQDELLANCARLTGVSL